MTIEIPLEDQAFVTIETDASVPGRVHLTVGSEGCHQRSQVALSHVQLKGLIVALAHIAVVYAPEAP